MPTVHLNGVDLYYEMNGAGKRLVMTHGSWTDHSSWAPALGALTERFEVVTWDRRGHSRSTGGDHPGCRDEDAADLAALIEHLGGGPVHVVGNSYGSIVVLTLVVSRPELVASAVVHEPPLVTLLEESADPSIVEALAGVDSGLSAVVAMIETGDNRAAAEYFVDQVALGPGSWARLTESFRAVLEANAPTFLDEQRDPTSGSIDVVALAGTSVPLMYTYGTEGPRWFRVIIDELALLVPGARVEQLSGAGHIPHATHPDQWVANLLAFHQSIDCPLRWRDELVAAGRHRRRDADRRLGRGRRTAAGAGPRLHRRPHHLRRFHRRAPWLLHLLRHGPPRLRRHSRCRRLQHRPRLRRCRRGGRCRGHPQRWAGRLVGPLIRGQLRDGWCRQIYQRQSPNPLRTEPGSSLPTRIDRGDRGGHRQRRLRGGRRLRPGRHFGHDRRGDRRHAPEPAWATRVAAAPTIPRECWVEHGWTYQPGEFDAITAPTLLLQGSESVPGIVKATADAARAISGSRIHLLEGHAHFAHKTDPVMVTSVMREFLSSGRVDGQS